MASWYHLGHSNVASECATDRRSALWNQLLYFSGAMSIFILVISTLKNGKESKHNSYMYGLVWEWRVPRSAHSVYLCVLFESQNKKWRFPFTALTYWFLGAFTKLRNATVSFVISVRLSAWNNSAPITRISTKFLYLVIFRKSIEKTQVSLKSDKNNGHFTHKPINNFDPISLSSSWNEKCLWENLFGKSKHTFYDQ
jgi:hypothetical protein